MITPKTPSRSNTARASAPHFMAFSINSIHVQLIENKDSHSPGFEEYWPAPLAHPCRMVHFMENTRIFRTLYNNKNKIIQ
jgi:hypothetical protein